jgi:hypothetical protein
MHHRIFYLFTDTLTYLGPFLCQWSPNTHPVYTPFIDANACSILSAYRNSDCYSYCFTKSRTN